MTAQQRLAEFLKPYEKSGEVLPPYRQIARQLCMTRNAVAGHVKRMRQNGLKVKTEPYGHMGGNREVQEKAWQADRLKALGEPTGTPPHLVKLR